MCIIIGSTTDDIVDIIELDWIYILVQQMGEIMSNVSWNQLIGQDCAIIFKICMMKIIYGIVLKIVNGKQLREEHIK